MHMPMLFEPSFLIVPHKRSACVEQTTQFKANSMNYHCFIWSGNDESTYINQRTDVVIA